MVEGGRSCFLIPAAREGPGTGKGRVPASPGLTDRDGQGTGSSVWSRFPSQRPRGTTLLSLSARVVLRMRRRQGKRKAEAAEVPRVSRRRTEEEEAVQEARRRAAPSVREFKFNKKRVRLISQGSDLKDDARCILYWMSRDQRLQDNWAFLYAQRLALKQELPLHVCFCLVPKFLEATIRHYGFMLRGLQEVAEECTDLNIAFHLLRGYAKDVLPTFVLEHGVGGLVTDFSPLRLPRQWVQDVRERLPEDVPFAQVDAHNIVPCWVASTKQEYRARTIRGKIHAQLPEFLTEFPPVIRHPYPPSCPAEVPAADSSALKASPGGFYSCFVILGGMAGDGDSDLSEVVCRWCGDGNALGEVGSHLIHSVQV